MSQTWQQILALGLVLLAAGHLAWRGLASFRRKKLSACGGCGTCPGGKGPAEGGIGPALVTLSPSIYGDSLAPRSDRPAP